MVIGVLAIQLGFIASYLAAFHHPQPHRIPLGVVAPAGASAQVSARLNTLPGDPLNARPLPDGATARQQIDDRRIDAALIVSAAGSTDRLLVASGAGQALSEATATVITKAEGSQNRRVAVLDIIPATAGDGRGLSAFYLVVGWTVGGYLVAALLGISAGARPANRSRAVIRLGTLAIYAVTSGIGGALLLRSAFGALYGNLAAMIGFGALLVFAVGAFTMGLQVVLGTTGVGLAIVLFVVLGNPSAGGPYPWPLQPAFFRAIGPWLPPGAGTSAVRGIAYFGGNGTLVPCLVLVGYAAVGLTVTLLMSGRQVTVIR